MPEGGLNKPVEPPQSPGPGSTRTDYIVIAALSLVGAVFAAVSGYSLSTLLPYVLLWASLCLTFFIYRRWGEEQRQRKNIEAANETPPVSPPVGGGSWEWDIRGNRYIWSDEIFKIYGLKKNEFDPSYSNFLKHVHPEDRLHVEEKFAGVLRENIPYEAEYRIVKPGGEVRIVHEQGTVLFKKRKPVSMSGYVTDVTDRKQVESDLRDQFGMLQFLMDAIPIPLYHKGEDGKYEGCNKAFEALTGAGNHSGKNHS